MTKVIGIAGGSASGKTTFCEQLATCLADKQVKCIHMDAFFKPKEERPHVPSHLNGRVYSDDNCPDTIDWEGFHRLFDESVSSGEYDVVIAEGLLVLWDEYIKDRLDVKVFMECRADERIVRRLRRNMKRGLSFDEIADVYLDMVRFRHDQYVEPTKWVADVIVNGSGNTRMACEMIAGRVKG